MYILLGIVEGFRNTFSDWTKSLNEWYTQYIAPWFTVQKWSNLYDTIKTQMKEKWDETVGRWISDISSWWKDNVAPWFTLQKWTEMMKNVPGAFKDIFKDAVNAAVKQINRLIDWVNKKLNFSFDGLEILGKEIIPAFEFHLFTLPHIPTFAAGGYPDTGEMFIARESGPEMVGRIGNRTAVANNGQIAEAIKNAVVEGILAVAPALSGSDKEIHIYLEGEANGIFRVMQTEAKNYTRRTSLPAFP